MKEERQGRGEERSALSQAEGPLLIEAKAPGE